MKLHKIDDKFIMNTAHRIVGKAFGFTTVFVISGIVLLLVLPSGVFSETYDKREQVRITPKNADEFGITVQASESGGKPGGGGRVFIQAPLSQNGVKHAAAWLVYSDERMFMKIPLACNASNDMFSAFFYCSSNALREVEFVLEYGNALEDGKIISVNVKDYFDE